MKSGLGQIRKALSAKFPVGTEIPLPQQVIDYLSVRRSVASAAVDHGQKNASMHLGWAHYAMTLPSPVDGIAWALFYQHAPQDIDTPRSCYPALKLVMSPDPARPVVTVHGVRDFDTDEYHEWFVHALAWEMDADIDTSELKMHPMVGAAQSALVEMGAIAAPSLDGGYDMEVA